MGWLARLARGDGSDAMAVAARERAWANGETDAVRGRGVDGVRECGGERGRRRLGRCRQYNRDGRACRGACHQRG